MELFEKVYGCYYRAVKRILEEASEKTLTARQMEEMIRENGFQESALTIIPKLISGEWALGSLDAKGSFHSAVSHIPRLPLTHLQKSWLKALLSDPRIALFLEEAEQAHLEEELAGVEPLFSQEDFYYFDRYRDGDDYASSQYRENFRTVLKAVREKKPLFAAYTGKKRAGIEASEADIKVYEVFPYQLQYSSKDDKFRLCCLQFSHGSFCQETILNLGRIRACHLSKREQTPDPAPFRFKNSQRCGEPVVISISGERNSLERCMLHFANYEKQTEYDEKTGEYRCSIYYDKADETELLIELLSFGPVIQILGPEPFLAQVRARVRRQHELF